MASLIAAQPHGPAQIRLGYALDYEFPQPTPMILTLNVHYSRASDLVQPYPSGNIATPSGTGAAGWSRRPGMSGSRATPRCVIQAWPT